MGAADPKGGAAGSVGETINKRLERLRTNLKKKLPELKCGRTRCASCVCWTAESLFDSRLKLDSCDISREAFMATPRALLTVAEPSFFVLETQTELGTCL